MTLNGDNEEEKKTHTNNRRTPVDTFLRIIILGGVRMGFWQMTR
jgi:hypothetical protein